MIASLSIGHTYGIFLPVLTSEVFHLLHLGRVDALEHKLRDPVARLHLRQAGPGLYLVYFSVSRLYLGCISAISWQYLGCISLHLEVALRVVEEDHLGGSAAAAVECGVGGEAKRTAARAGELLSLSFAYGVC